MDIQPCKYDYIISLGWFCSTAKELERYGFRDSSYPFDWLLTPELNKVIELIKNRFDDWFIYENFAQYANNPEYYFDIKLHISYFHDFKKNKHLNMQFDEIKSKYNRRITRFYDAISKPTLFLRYIKDANEAIFVKKNIAYILDVIKSFNEQNDIIFIGNNESEILSQNICRFIVEPDVNDTVAREFLDKAVDLSEFLNSGIYDETKRQANHKAYYKKIKNDSGKIKKRKKKIMLLYNRYIKKNVIHNMVFDPNNGKIGSNSQEGHRKRIKSQ